MPAAVLARSVRWLRGLLPAAAATLIASVALGAVFVGVRAAVRPADLQTAVGAWNPSALVTAWAWASVFALPVGFIAGLIGLVILRSLRRPPGG